MADPITALFEIIGAVLSFIFTCLLYLFGGILVVLSFANPFRICSTVKNASEDPPGSLFSAACLTFGCSLVDIPCFFMALLIAFSWRCGSISYIYSKEGFDMHSEILSTFLIVLFEYFTLPAFFISIISWRRVIVCKEFNLSEANLDIVWTSYEALFHVITDIIVYGLVLPFPLLSWRYSDACELIAKEGSYDTKLDILWLFVFYLFDWVHIVAFLLGICGPRFFAGMRLLFGKYDDKRSMVWGLLVFNLADILYAIPVALLSLMMSPFVRSKAIFRTLYCNYKLAEHYRSTNSGSDDEKIGLIEDFYVWHTKILGLACIDFLLTLPAFFALFSLRAKNIVSSLWKIEDKALEMVNNVVTYQSPTSERQVYVAEQLGLWFLDLFGIPAFLILQVGIRGSEARRAVFDPLILGMQVHICLFNLLGCQLIDFGTAMPLLLVLFSWRKKHAWAVIRLVEERDVSNLPGYCVTYNRHYDIYYLILLLIGDMATFPALIICLFGSRHKSTRRLVWAEIPFDRMLKACTGALRLPKFEKHSTVWTVLLPLTVFDMLTAGLCMVLFVTPRRHQAIGILYGTMFVGQEYHAKPIESSIDDISFSVYAMDDKRHLLFKHRQILALFFILLIHDILFCLPFFCISCASLLRIGPALSCLLTPSPDDLKNVSDLAWKWEGLCIIAVVSVTDVICFPLMLMTIPSWRCSDVVSILFFDNGYSVNDALMKMSDYACVRSEVEVLEKHGKIFSLFFLYCVDLLFLPFVLISSLDVIRLPLLCRVLCSDPFWNDGPVNKLNPDPAFKIDDVTPAMDEPQAKADSEEKSDDSEEKSVEGEVVGQTDLVVASNDADLTGEDNSDRKKPDSHVASNIDNVTLAVDKSNAVKPDPEDKSPVDAMEASNAPKPNSMFKIDPTQYKGGSQFCFCKIVTVHPYTIIDVSDRFRKHSCLLGVFLVCLLDFVTFPFAFILFCSWRIGDLSHLLFVPSDQQKEPLSAEAVDVVCEPAPVDIYDWKGMYIAGIMTDNTKKNKQIFKLFLRYLIDICLIPVVIALCIVPWEIPYLSLQLKEIKQQEAKPSIARYVKILAERLLYGLLKVPVVAIGMITVVTFWRLPQLVSSLYNWFDAVQVEMNLKTKKELVPYVPLTVKFPSNKKEVDTYYESLSCQTYYNTDSFGWIVVVVKITMETLANIFITFPCIALCCVTLYRLPRIWRIFGNPVKRMLWMHGLLWNEEPGSGKKAGVVATGDAETGGEVASGEGAEGFTLKGNTIVGPGLKLSKPRNLLDPAYQYVWHYYPYELSFYDPIHSLFCYHAIQVLLDVFPTLICTCLFMTGYRIPQAWKLLRHHDPEVFRDGSYGAAVSVLADFIFLFPCLFIIVGSMYRIPLFLYMVLKDICRFSDPNFSLQSEVPHVSSYWMADCTDETPLEPVYIMMRTHAVDSVLLFIADILATICLGISAISPMRFISFFVLSCQSTETNEHLITKSMLDSEWSNQHIFMAEIEKIEDALGELFMKRDENSASSLIERLLNIAERYTGGGSSGKLLKLDLPTNKLLNKDPYVEGPDNVLPTPYSKSTYITRSKIAADIDAMHSIMMQYARDVVASYPHHFDLLALRQPSLEASLSIGNYAPPTLTKESGATGGNRGLIWRIARASELSTFMETFWASVRDIRTSPPLFASLAGFPGLRERFFDLKVRLFCVFMAAAAVLDIVAILGAFLIVLTVYRLPQMVRLVKEVKGPDGIRTVVLLQTRALSIDIGYLLLLCCVVIPLLTRSIDTVGGAITDIIQKKPSAAIHARIWTAARRSILDWANLFAIISVREFVALTLCSVVAGAFVPAAMFYFVFKSLFCGGECEMSCLISLVTVGFTLVLYVVPTNAFVAVLPKMVSSNSYNNEEATAEATTAITVLLGFHGIILLAAYMVLARSRTFVSLYVDTDDEEGSKKKKKIVEETHVNPLLRIRATMPNKLAILNLFIEIMQMSSIVFLVTGVPWSESMNAGAISFAKAVFFQDYQSARQTYDNTAGRRLEEESYLEVSANNFMGELGFMYLIKVILLCIWFLLVTIPTVSERVEVLVHACCLEKREIGYYSMNPIVRNFCIFISGSMFLSLCQTMFNTLSCKYSVTGEKPYVSADPSMNCWVGAQTFWAAFMSLAFTFFLPTALLIGVYERSRRVRDIDVKFTEMVTTNANVAKLGMAAAVAFSDNPSQALILILLLSLAVVTISVRYKQIFKTDMGTIWEANTFHILSYLLCAWSCVAGLIAISIDDKTNDTSGRLYIYGLIIIFLVVFGYILLRRRIVQASVLRNDDKFLVARLKNELELLVLCMPETLMKAVWRNKLKAAWLKSFARMTTYVDAAKLVEAFAYQIRAVAFDRSCVAVEANAQSNASDQHAAIEKENDKERLENNNRRRAHQAYDDGKVASSKLFRSVSSEEFSMGDDEEEFKELDENFDPFLEASTRSFSNSGSRYTYNHEELPLPHPLTWWIRSLRSSEHPLQVLRKLRELEHSLAPECCLLCRNLECAKAMLALCTSSFGNSALVDPLVDVVFSKLGLAPQPRLGDKIKQVTKEPLTQKLKFLEHSFLWGMDVAESRLGDKKSGGLLQFVQRLFSNEAGDLDLFSSISKNFMSSFVANSDCFVGVCNKDLTYDEAKNGLKDAAGIGWGNPLSRPCIASVIHIDSLLSVVKASLSKEDEAIDMRDSVTATVGLWGGMGRHMWKVMAEQNYWSFPAPNIVNWRQSREDAPSIISDGDKTYHDPYKGCYVEIDPNFKAWSYGYGCNAEPVAKSSDQAALPFLAEWLPEWLPQELTKEAIASSLLSERQSVVGTVEHDARVIVIASTLSHGMRDIIAGLRSYLFPSSPLSGSQVLVNQSYICQRPMTACSIIFYDDWKESYYVSPLSPFWPLIMRTQAPTFCSALDVDKSDVKASSVSEEKKHDAIPVVMTAKPPLNDDNDFITGLQEGELPPSGDDFSDFIGNLQGDAGAAAAPVKSLHMKPDSDIWTCEFCETIHDTLSDRRRTTCKNCYSAKPTPVGQYWKCQGCNHFNSPSVTRVRYCETCNKYGGPETIIVQPTAASKRPARNENKPWEKQNEDQTNSVIAWAIQLELKDQVASIDQRMGYFDLDNAELLLNCLDKTKPYQSGNGQSNPKLKPIVPLRPSQVFIVQGIVIVSNDTERGANAKSADSTEICLFLNGIRRRVGLQLVLEATAESKTSQHTTTLLNLSGVGAGASSMHIDPDVVKLRKNILRLLMVPIAVIADHSFKNTYTIKKL